MKQVKVTFTIDADDPEDRIGITEETYDAVNEAIAHLGGDDVEFEKQETVAVERPRRRKKP